MKIYQDNKGILALVVIFVIVILGYNLLFKTDLSLLTEDSTSADVGSDVLDMFNSLQSVSLDPSLFSSPAYLLLTDFSVPIPVQATGRKNPFAAIGKN